MSTQLSALLLVATLKIGSISKSCEDVEMSTDVQIRSGAEKDEAKVVKPLFREPLKPINSLEGRARMLHRRMTFQGIGDDRLLAPGERERHTATMEAVKSEWQAAVDDFIAHYYQHLLAEKGHKKGAYNINDYQSKEAAADSFRFTYGYQPMGNPNQFVQLFANEAQRAEAEQLKARYEQQLASTVANVSRTQFNEVLNLVRRVAEVLGDPDRQLIDSPTRKGPLTYLREYVDRLPMTNVTGDATIESLRQQVLSLIDVQTDHLREFALVRQTTAEKAQAIVQSFTSLGRRKFAA